jgi:hypothetical protein
MDTHVHYPIRSPISTTIFGHRGFCTEDTEGTEIGYEEARRARVFRDFFMNIGFCSF